MSLLASWLTSPAPDAAIEISAQRVAAATMVARGGSLVVPRFVSEVLPAGVVAPSLTSQNIASEHAVVDALRRIIRELGDTPRRVALVVPDLTAKVSLVRFDSVPGRPEDLEQLIRWQVRKSAPFPIDDAAVTYAPGGTDENGGAEFVVVLARRAVVQEYERICSALGAHAGLVDLATFSVVNLFLADAGGQQGDWLLVNVRPDYTSLAVMRGSRLVFFRNRADADGESLGDLVHQTAMYYQDRLAGEGFERVFLAGGSQGGSSDQMRRTLEDRLNVPVDVVDPTRAVTFVDRIRLPAEARDTLSSVAGMLVRSRAGAVAA
jgi:Tfp pilus assembly PilM family ATPase